MFQGEDGVKTLQEDVINVLREEVESGSNLLSAERSFTEAKNGLLQVEFTLYASNDEPGTWKIYWEYCLQDENIGNEVEELWDEGGPEPWRWSEIFE